MGNGLRKGYERHNCSRARELTYILIFSVTPISARSIFHDGGAARATDDDGDRRRITEYIYSVTFRCDFSVGYSLVFRRNLRTFPQQKKVEFPTGRKRSENSFPGLFQNQTTPTWTVGGIAMTPG